MRQNPRPPYEPALRAGLLKGLSVEEAAHAAGCCRATAFRWLQEHRIELVAEALRTAPALRHLFPGSHAVAAEHLASRGDADREESRQHLARGESGDIEQKLVAPPPLAMDGEGKFSGYASVFNEPHPTSTYSLPPDWQDVIAPGAFADTLAEHDKTGAVPMLWMHERGNVPGVWTSLKETHVGLAVTGQVSKSAVGPSGVPLLELMKMGAVTGLSIGFRATKVALDEAKKIRTILAADLTEISIVDSPGDPSARIADVKSSPMEELVDVMRGFAERLRDEVAEVKASSPAADAKTTGSAASAASRKAAKAHGKAAAAYGSAAEACRARAVEATKEGDHVLAAEQGALACEHDEMAAAHLGAADSASGHAAATDPFDRNRGQFKSAGDAEEHARENIEDLHAPESYAERYRAAQLAPPRTDGERHLELARAFHEEYRARNRERDAALDAYLLTPAAHH